MLIVLPGSNELAVNISDYWSDQHGIGIRGWVSAEAGPPHDLEFVFEDTIVPVTSWHARDDIAQKAPLGLPWQSLGILVLPAHSLNPICHRSAP